jgi:hypothetical protein
MMQTPRQITIRHIANSPALTARIRRRRDAVKQRASESKADPMAVGQD